MNQPLLNALPPDEVDVVIQRAGEAEVDEMWSYVGKKTAPRWVRVRGIAADIDLRLTTGTVICESGAIED